MWLCLVWIFFVSYSFPGSLGSIKWQSRKEAEQEWEKAARKSTPGAVSTLLRSSPSMGSDFLYMPAFVQSSSSEARIALFQPDMNVQPRPESMKTLLFPTVPPPSRKAENSSADVLCHIERLYVRVNRKVFNGARAFKFLTLGKKCGVNIMNPDYFLMVYFLSTDCGYTIESNEDELIVYNTVKFDPNTTIYRDLPFEIKIKCTYHRYINAYKGAIRPAPGEKTLYKSLRRRNRPIVLTSLNENGVEGTTFELGDIMFFEAKLAYGYPFSPNERMYIHKCFITPSVVPSYTNNTVIENSGCMVDPEALEGEGSAFLPGPKISQRFSIKAGVSSEMAKMPPGKKRVYIHCEVSLGPQPASESRKACNYDAEAGRWRELYDPDSDVCSCCETSCPPPASVRAARGKRVISRPLEIKTL